MVRPRKNKRIGEIKPIHELQLCEYASHGAIRELRATKVSEGYVLLVVTNFETDPLVFHTQRGNPRAWVSLDRLATFVQRRLPRIQRLSVDFER